MRNEGGSFEELRPAHEAPAADAAQANGGAPVAPTIELVPRTSGRILDTALDIARERFGLYVAVASALWFIARALQPFVHRYTQIDPSNADYSMQAGFMSMGVALANVFVVVVVQSLATMLIAILAWPAVLGLPVELGRSVWHSLRKLPGVLLIQLLQGMAVGVLAVCTCGIGWLWMQWKFSLTVIAYVIEPGGLGAAITRSFQLTSRDSLGWPAFAGFLRWLAVFGTAFTAAFFFSSLSAIDDSPFQIRAAVLDRIAAPVWAIDVALVLITTLLNGVATAISSVAMIAYYVDCRVRRDGWDLELKLKALSAGSAPVQPEIAERA